MLRRTQTISFRDEVEPEEAQAPAAAPAAEPVRPNPIPANDRRGADRRQGDRRGMDALRTEALQKVISAVEDRNFGGLKNRVHWGRGFKPSRFMLIAVALVAGGLAAYLATQRTPAVVPVEKAAEVIMEARAQILAAKGPIEVGERLSAENVEWVDWPEGAILAEYVTAAVTPEAITEMTGSMARFQFFAGEPIREQKLVAAGNGFLSTLLTEGKRGVSINITGNSAAGGYIVPTDHVDVVLTRDADDAKVSETILQNVRVIAIGHNLGPTPEGGEDGDDDKAPKLFDQAVATLELDPLQTELVINAGMTGPLSLVLRAMSDFPEPASDPRTAVNRAIRLSSPFWTSERPSGDR